MWAIIKRVIPPILLLLAGIGSLLYGTLYHHVSIVEDKQVTEKIPIPGPFMPGMPLGQPALQRTQSPENQPAASEEKSPFEPPAANEEEKSPFETPASKEPGKTPSKTPDDERSLMERFSLTEENEEEKSPFETPAAKQQEKAPSEKPDEEQSLMERFSLREEPDSEDSMSGGLPFGGLEQSDGPGLFGGPPQFVEDTRTISVPRDEPETVVIREVTIGGLARLENGELKRTYSGKAPSLCPT